MTGTPQILLQTPDAPADALSDLLDRMHLAGMVLFRGEFREPWSVAAPKSCDLARMLPFRTEQIIPFHVVASGGCWLQLPGHGPVWLREGDAVLLPGGDSHHLNGRETAAPVHVGQLLPKPPWCDIPSVEHGGAGANTTIICGFLQCDELLFHPILRQLPPLLHVSPDHATTENWLASTIRHTAAVASNPAPGSRSMLPRLTELMFVEILRTHMQTLSANDVGLLAAYNDPVAGAGLRCLHTQPFHDWTVESLARQIGVSRTALAERFKRFLDLPPIQYLSQWRLRLAAQTLKSTDLRIKTVADQTGYDSEAAFSRAFKRHFGQSPAAWRKQHARHVDTGLRQALPN